MFANIATAFLVSLGIALVIIIIVKGVYPRFSFEIRPVLVMAFAVLGSTLALTVAISSGKVYKYVVSLEEGAKNMTDQAEVMQSEYGLDRFGLSVAGFADGYVDGTASFVKTKLEWSRTLSIIVTLVLNSLLAVFLLHAGKKARYYRRPSSGADDLLNDLEVSGGSSLLDDLDLD